MLSQQKNKKFLLLLFFMLLVGPLHANPAGNAVRKTVPVVAKKIEEFCARHVFLIFHSFRHLTKEWQMVVVCSLGSVVGGIVLYDIGKASYSKIKKNKKSD